MKTQYMPSLKRLAGLIMFVVSGILSLLIADHTVNVFATRADETPILQTAPELAFAPRVFLPIVMRLCPPLVFNDEFDTLDLARWIVVRDTVTISGGWLTLSGGELQSIATFQQGCLQGAIQSSDWKPYGPEFTDSSFGFEIWTGTNGRCHYGIVVKASGQLAVLRPQPDLSGNCFGDPEKQAYIEISNWNNVRPPDGTVGVIYFMLVWSQNDVVLTINDGNANQGQASYSGPALPVIPLKIRLFAYTPNLGTAETFSIDYIRLDQDLQ